MSKKARPNYNSTLSRYFQARRNSFRATNATNVLTTKSLDTPSTSEDTTTVQSGDLRITQQLMNLNIRDKHARTKSLKPEEMKATLKPAKTLTKRNIAAAVATYNLTLLDELLSADDDDKSVTEPMIRDVELRHALRLAVSNNQPLFVQKLLQAGADLHAYDQSLPLLILALDVRATEIFRLLVGHAKTLSVENSHGNLIHAATRVGDVEVLKSIVENVPAAEINARTKVSGCTPLYEAVRHIKANIKPKSVTEGRNQIPWQSMSHLVAKTQNRDVTERTATNEKRFYDMDCIDYLINKGCDVNAKDSNGKTALHLCAILGIVPVAKRILQAGASKMVVDSNNHTPIMYAIMHKYNVTFSELFHDETTVNQPLTLDGRYHIHLACLAGNLGVLQYLITAGCDANVRHNGETPLMITIENRKFQCAEYLLNLPTCDVLLEGTASTSALKYMLQQDVRDDKLGKKTTLLSLLIKRGLDINQPCSNTGLTPLLFVLHRKPRGWLPYLLENGADVNYVTEDKEYALLLACYENRTEAVRLLLKHNQNMALSALVSNQRNSLTPFQLALRHENREMIKLLLGAGCSVMGTKIWFETFPGMLAKRYLMVYSWSTYEYIEAVQMSPLSLQDLARCQIRKEIGVKDTLVKYDLLPLPVKLKTSLASYEKYCVTRD